MINTIVFVVFVSFLGSPVSYGLMCTNVYNYLKVIGQDEISDKP